jgi:hypothetical protein
MGRKCAPELPKQIPVHDHGSESTRVRPKIHHCFSEALTDEIRLCMLFMKSYLQK